MRPYLEPVNGSSRSPFDAIKHSRPGGMEFWSARDLMPLMGYPRWNEFKVPIERAIVAARNQGVDVVKNFRVTTEVKKPGARGPAGQDYHLSRFAAYLVAMNGDPNKKEVASAQAYFAVRTHEAEITEQRLSLPQTYAEALRELAETVEAKEAVEQRNAALKRQAAIDAPKATFADAVSTSNSTILVGDLAKILKGNGVDVGANRLFKWLRENRFLIARRGTDWNMPTQRSMELGLFQVKETAVTHADGHVTVNRTPKVTGKGQTYFVSRFMNGTFNLKPHLVNQ